jgi:hypothetical protein
MFAQAMLETGAVDSLVTSVTSLVRDVTIVFYNQPWLIVALIVVAFLLLVRRGK